MNHFALKKLQNCDLNLLLSLAFLIEEQSVSKAAYRLNISQPAMSNNLKKLRILFNEPLFIKHGQGLKATDNAQRLLPHLKNWLHQSSELILKQDFNPSNAHGIIRIAFMDDLTPTVLPMILDTLIQTAPNIELEFVNKTHDLFRLLETGELDLAVAGSETPPVNVHGRYLTSEEFCAAYAPTHPLAKQSPSCLADILKYETCEYTASIAVEKNINQLINKRHLNRQVTFSSESMIVMQHALLAGLHVGFVPIRTLQQPQWKGKLTGTILEDLPIFESTLYWHARVHSDPLIQWFKDLLLDTTARFRQQLDKKNNKNQIEG